MKHLYLFFVVLMVLLLAVPGVALAQEDATTETPVIVVPVEDGETEETPATLEPGLSAGEFALTIWELGAIILSGFVSGGVVGIGGVGFIARRIMDDPKGVVAVEKLGDSVPAETAARILDFSRSVVDVMRLLEEALDRVPAAEKPLPPEVAQG